MSQARFNAKTLLRHRGLLLLALAAGLVSCGGGGDGEGGDCQACRSATPQCDTGLTCQRFQSSLVVGYALCAKPTTTSCPVPF